MFFLQIASIFLSIFSNVANANIGYELYTTTNADFVKIDEAVGIQLKPKDQYEVESVSCMLVEGNSTKLMIQNGCPTNENVKVEINAIGIHFILNPLLLYRNDIDIFFQCESVLCIKQTPINCKKFSGCSKEKSSKPSTLAKIMLPRHTCQSSTKCKEQACVVSLNGSDHCVDYYNRTEENFNAQVSEDKPIDICAYRDMDIIRANAGNLTSPLYPQKYPKHVKCKKTIRVDTRHIVEIKFLSFDVEYNPSCAYDWVTYYIGEYQEDGASEKHCGKELPEMLASTNNKVTITFDTDNVGINNNGFKMSWSQRKRFTILEYTLNYNPKIFTSNILIVGGGVVCNSFSLLCMLILREFMKSAFHRYLMCFTIANLFYLSAAIPYETHQADHLEWKYSDVWCKTVQAFNWANFYITLLCLLWISIDQYISIVHRKKNFKLLKYYNHFSFSCLIILFVLGASFLLSSPIISNSYKKGDFCIFDKFNSSIPLYYFETDEETPCNHDHLTNAPWKTFVYLHFFVLFSVPALIMIGMYAAILRYKVKSKISPKETDEVRSMFEIRVERRSLRTAYLLTANFILCYVPLFTLHFLKVNGISKHRETCLEWDGVSNLMARVNNLINPFIIFFSLSGGFIRRIRAAGRVISCRDPDGVSEAGDRLLIEDYMSYDYSEYPQNENDVSQKSDSDEKEDDEPVEENNVDENSLSQHEENEQKEESAEAKPNPALNKTLSLEITISSNRQDSK